MEFHNSLHPVVNVKPINFTMKTHFKVFAIVILATLLSAFTESRTITGKVTDTAGQPLSGVTVKSKPSFAVTTTDQNGNYRIVVEKQTMNLIFSLPGYSSLVEKIGERSLINLRLGQEAVPAEDVNLYKRTD